MGTRSALGSALLTLLIAAAGCGGDDSTRDAKEPQNSASPTESSSAPALRISTAAMCNLLFETNDEPVQDLLDAWDKDSVSQEEVDELAENVGLLRDIAPRAPEEYEPHVNVLADITEEYVAAATDGTEMTHDRTDLQASGLELATACG